MMFSWIFILAIVVWAIWYYGKGNDAFLRKIPKEDPIDLLKRRFANGEITEKEYNERKKVLGRGEIL